MKLRNKLVAVLAASMVVTSVPVVTMADTTNYVSTGRYAQKGTTYGYLAGTYDGYDVVYGQNIGIGASKASDGYSYTYSNGFEFVPSFDYKQEGSMFMSLTKDTDFNEQAILTYVDAFNSYDGHSNLAVKDGVVVKANNVNWNGRKVSDLLKDGVTMYFNNTSHQGSAKPAYEDAPLRGVTLAQVQGQIDSIFDAKVASARLDGSFYVADDTETPEVKALNEIKELLKKEFDEKFVEGGFKAGNITLSLQQVEDIVEKALKEVQSANEKTTSYSQLYKAGSNPSVIDSKTVEKITKETVADVEAWLGTTLASAYAGIEHDETITIRKVDSFDVKDAADREYKSHLRVDFKGDFERGASYKVPVLAKVGGDQTVILNIDGRDSFVSSGKYNLTQDVVSDKRLTVTGKDDAKLRKNYADPIGELKFTETQIKSLYNDGKNRKIQITLPASSDLEFNLNKTLANAKAKGMRGFSGNGRETDPNKNIELTDLTSTEANTDKLRIAYGISSRRNSYTDVDKQTLIVELPAFKDATAVGEIELSGIYVQPKDDVATPGDVNVTVKEYLASSWTSASNVNQYVEAAYDSNGNYKHYNVQYYTYNNSGYTSVAYPSTQTINRSNQKLYVVSNVTTTISGSTRTEASTDLIKETTVKVGEVREYDLSLTCEKPTSIKAGRSGLINDKTTTFILEENVKDSLVDSRKIEFVLENGYMFGPADIDYTDTAANTNAGIYASTNYKQKALDKFEQLVNDKTIKFEEKAEAKEEDGKKYKGFDLSTLELRIDAEGRVIGFSGEYDRLKESEADKIKITVPVATDVMSEGDVKVAAKNVYTRSFQDKDEDPSCVVANITKPIEVTFDGAKLKVGKQNQEAGSITIKETDKGMLERGWLFLAAQDQEGITFDKVPTVTVEGTDGKVLKVKNVELSKDKTMVGIEITTASLEASTIKVNDILLTADRTVPEANYDLAIWGTALTDENELGITNFTQNALYSHAYFNQTSDLYTVKDFVQMTTLNTEDLSNTAKAVTTSFVIGENGFTVNGEKVTTDSAAYIKDNYTFVPVRYLAQAFGIEGNAVQYDQKTSTATIVYGDKVINITNGKANLVVNGTAVPMATKAEVKDGRMCVPMAYIAAALGVEKSWDATTKTATFTNVKTTAEASK